HPFDIDGIVILHDHFHMLITLPENDGNYSLRLRLIKGYFSREIYNHEYINFIRKKKNERGIWQRRFWEHAIRDENDYERHLNYIHYNPVKHGYVKNASDWPYSSIHRAINQGLYPKNWGYKDDFSLGVFGE
ncbi:MAG: transposase, partial [Legionella sp.]